MVPFFVFTPCCYYNDLCKKNFIPAYACALVYFFATLEEGCHVFSDMSSKA